MALPLLMLVALGLVWALGVAGQQVRTVDAAREAARAVARGDSEDVASATALASAPQGSRVSYTYAQGRVSVTVTASVAPPGASDLFERTVTLTSTAVAALEPGVGTTP